MIDPVGLPYPEWIRERERVETRSRRRKLAGTFIIAALVAMTAAGWAWMLVTG